MFVKFSKSLPQYYRKKTSQKQKLIPQVDNVLQIFHPNEHQLVSFYSKQNQHLIENYTLKDGKAFPGLSLLVTDASGTDILNETDLFASYTEGVSPEDAAVLRGSVTVGNPMKSGETYHCKMRVFDKNSDAEITSELAFEVK